MKQTLYAFWLLLRLGLIFGVVAFLFTREGTVAVTWGQTELSLHLGFTAVALFFAFCLFALVYHYWRVLVGLPRRLRKDAQVRKTHKGYNALSKGLLAVASGDTKAASNQAKKAQSLLPQAPLTKLLQAQSALLRDDSTAAEAHFNALLESKDSAVFGLRGLLVQAEKRGDDSRALQLAQQAFAAEPKKPWTANTLFQQEAKNENWDAAATALKAMKKQGEAVKPLRAHVNLARSLAATAAGEQKAALNLAEDAAHDHPEAPEVVIQLAQCLLSLDHKRRARRVIRKGWRLAPHPRLAQLWLESDDKAVDALARLKAAEKLVKENPGHLESELFLARMARKASLWGVAQDHLNVALQKPDADLRIAQEVTALRAGDSELHDSLKQLDATTLAPAPAWTDSETGQIYEAWQPLNSERHFGTISWAAAPGPLPQAIAA